MRSTGVTGTKTLQSNAVPSATGKDSGGAGGPVPLFTSTPWTFSFMWSSRVVFPSFLFFQQYPSFLYFTFFLL